MLNSKQSALVKTAAKGFTVSKTATLASADALVGLKATGLSLRDIERELKATGATFAPSYVTIGRYIKVRESLPADVTAEAYAQALTDATTAASKAGANNKRADKKEDSQDESAVTAGNSESVPVTTPDQVVAALQGFASLAAGFTTADRSRVAEAALALADTLTAPAIAVPKSRRASRRAA